MWESMGKVCWVSSIAKGSSNFHIPINITQPTKCKQDK